jgi:hypothetical protein
MWRNPWQRPALLLIGCALLLRLAVPAGWMPQFGAGQVTLSWCADSGLSGPGALAEAKALLAKATGEKPDPAHKSAPDHPCAFAAAPQPLPAVDTAPLPPAPAMHAPRLRPQLLVAPGRGLAAPPPHSTGPPLLA